MLDRRHLIKGSVATAAVAATGIGKRAAAQVKEVKIGMIAPLSGPWARQGELMKMGGDLAVKHINAQGGIKALGGAKLQLLTFDAGDSAEKAKNAAQRMIAQEPDLVAASGAWLSSFTLAVSEVTERAELPLLTLSYSDQITARGFKHIFQTSPTGGTQATVATPTLVDLALKATGKKPSTVAIVMDNTAAPVSFAKPMREGGLENLGLKLVVDEIFTPPLADATSMIQKVRSARPDILMLLATNIPDDKLLLEKLNEFGLGKGRLPVIGNGAHIGAPELLKTIGKDLMEGVMFIVANWPSKGQEAIVADFKKETGEPWMTQDSLCTYGDVWIMKEALEMAGKADRRAVSEAIHKLDTTEGPAKFFPGGRVKFLENGRRDGAVFVIAQWQNGEPITVYPPASAIKDPIWPKR
ncbi:MAG TPA: ABC transporter substrate-binding protein [Hyphomicrobiaceae bacterium]|nr:ABC transporter substrate-binding protein [Hyphomicrobiaceae bacterium]